LTSDHFDAPKVLLINKTLALQLLAHGERQPGASHQLRTAHACSVGEAVAIHSIGSSAWAKAYYEQQRAKGKPRNTVVRALAFKWIRILFRCWKDHKPYSEEVYRQALARRKRCPSKCSPVQLQWKTTPASAKSLRLPLDTTAQMSVNVDTLRDFFRMWVQGFHMLCLFTHSWQATLSSKPRWNRSAEQQSALQLRRDAMP
jgi:hypothetical protein